MSLKLKRQEIVSTGRKLLSEGLVTRSWGNISMRVDENNMLITPSGRTYDDLREEEIVLMNYNTLAYDGKIKPSSEYRLHAEIYRRRNDINAVIHTHQPNASTLAVARRQLPPVIDDMAQIIGPSVKVTKYAYSGTGKFARQAVKYLRGRQAVLLANHGAVCVGRNLEEAFVVTHILEKAAKAFIEAELIGGATHVSKVSAYWMHQMYLKKYSKMNEENR